MPNQRFRDSLLAVYHGEQFGEAVFESMLEQAADDEQRFIIGTLLQLETEGKAIVRPVLSGFGLSLKQNPDARARGKAGAQSLQDMSWTEKFASMAASIRARGLPQYEELATLVSVDEDPIAYRLALFMGRHERAILEASENVASGRMDPMAPVIEVLHFPLNPLPGVAH